MLPRVGANIPLTVEVEDQKGEDICFVREVQRHPVTEDVLHVDFLRVDVQQTIRAEVPIILQGSAPAARESGGTLLQPLQNLLVEALPMNIPASVEVDVSELDDFEKGVYVRDLLRRNRRLYRHRPRRPDRQGQPTENRGRRGA